MQCTTVTTKKYSRKINEVNASSVLHINNILTEQYKYETQKNKDQYFVSSERTDIVSPYFELRDYKVYKSYFSNTNSNQQKFNIEG